MGLARGRSIMLVAAVALVACPASWRGAAVPRPSASISVDIERKGDEIVIDYEIINRGHDPIYAFVHPPQPTESTTPLGDAAYVYFSRPGEITIGLAPLFFQPWDPSDVFATPRRYPPPVYSDAARIGPKSNYHGWVHVPLPLEYTGKYDGYSVGKRPAPTTPTTITKLTFEVAYMDWRDLDVVDSYVEHGDVYFHALPDIRIHGSTSDPDHQTSNLYYAVTATSVSLPAKLPPEQYRYPSPRPAVYGIP